MNTPLLATKLHQPALHPRRVQRTRLVERLDEGLAAGHGLVLISAPAGFGKTTCVCEWLSRLDRPAAWLSLEPADDAPGRFFPYFLAALQRLDARVGREIEGALLGGQLPPAETLTAALIDDLLRLEQPLVLVCDDFHHIQDGYILAVLERLLHQRLPGLLLVLVTREDPPMPLARLRANNYMTEIRAADLRFSQQEAAGLLRGTLGLALSEPDVAALDQRTEGWAAGLQLAGLSLRGRSDPGAFIAALRGSHRTILSYLTEEVLARQSAEVQAFLQQTSILTRLSGPLCDALTGGSGSGQLIERLFNANLFLIPLDDEQRWYRFHHLFADLLRSLQNRLPEGQISGLHARAARWFVQAGLPGEAIEHAVAAGDHRLALAQVEQNAMPTLVAGDVMRVQAWLQAIPAHIRERSPRANVALGWLNLLRGDYAAAMQQAGLAAAAIDAVAAAGETAAYPAGDAAAQEASSLALAAETGTAGSPALADVRADLLALKANLENVLGRPAQGIALAQAALALAGPQAHYVRGQAWLALGGAYRLQGDYPPLVEAYQQAIQYCQSAGNILSEAIAVSGLLMFAYQRGELHLAMRVGAPLLARVERQHAAPPPITGTVYGALGMVYYQWNRLDEARAAIQHSLQLASLGGHNAGLVYSRILLARLALAEGDLERAARAMHEVAAGLQQGVPAWLLPEVTDQQVRLYLAQDQPEQAAAVLAGTRTVPGDERPPAGVLEGSSSALQPTTSIAASPPHPPARAAGSDLLALAGLRLAVYRLELGSSQAAAVVEQATQLIEAARAAGRMAVVLQALLLRARLQQHLGHRTAALDDILQAVALAQPEGCIRVFVDEGPLMAELLEAALPHCDAYQAAYARTVLGAFPQEGKRQGEWTGLDPLSEREIEVLRLIAAGLKYQEIADKLVVSLNTVRFHVKTIYSKLGVTSRTQAVEHARRVHILG